MIRASTDTRVVEMTIHNDQNRRQLKIVDDAESDELALKGIDENMQPVSFPHLEKALLWLLCGVEPKEDKP